jgi:hypothetical protein
MFVRHIFGPRFRMLLWRQCEHWAFLPRVNFKYKCIASFVSCLEWSWVTCLISAPRHSVQPNQKLFRNLTGIITQSIQIMSDPTKAETEQIFTILKAQKANKVRTKILCRCQPDCQVLILLPVMFRLFGAQSHLGQCHVRCIRLS